MREEGFGLYAKYYDAIYLKMKNYEKEAAIVKRIIRQFENLQSKTLLDVGCGTGEHLKYLSSDFQCIRIHINSEMLKIASRKVPDARFRIADMISFSLEEKFDVIVCLFSSIGYVSGFNNLAKTLENFRVHLNDRGLLIVEP